MPKDLGVDVSNSTKIDQAVHEVRIDAFAVRETAARRGAGIIVFFATPTLWVQQFTQDGKVKITNNPGASKSADLGTRDLVGGSTQRALEKCHCHGWCRFVGRCAGNHGRTFIIEQNLTRSRKRYGTWTRATAGAASVVELNCLRDHMAQHHHTNRT